MTRTWIYGLSVMVLAGVSSLSAGMQPVEAGGFSDRFARSAEIRENEARGGPKVQGVNSPFLVRVRVCQDLPLRTKDKASGKTIKRTVERCWFE